jgi:hypothetical protein
VNTFLSQILEISDMDVSSFNYLNYSSSKCLDKDCSHGPTTVSFPYCSDCLSAQFGLAVRMSYIPGAGVGLFATKDFSKGQSLGFEYSGPELNTEEYEYLAKKSTNDSRSANRLNYLMKLGKDRYVDASRETGGPLRFINESPAENLTNSQFHVITVRKIIDGKERDCRVATVKTTKAVKIGCEFFLVYDKSGFQIPYNPHNSTTESGLKQRRDVISAILNPDD